MEKSPFIVNLPIKKWWFSIVFCMFTTRSHFRNRWERMGSQWCDFYHLLPGIRRVLWTQHTPKLVPQIKGFRVQHTLNRFYMDICGICANIVHIFFRASPRHVQQPSEAMSCRARQRTMNSCSLGNLGVVNSGRWRKMVSNVTTLILFCVGKLHLCGKIDASLCVTTSFAGHGGYMKILAGHSSGSGLHPQSLGSMPCRRKAHHGGVSKESSVRSWGRLSMGFVGDWTGWIDGWDSSAYGISLVMGIPFLGKSLTAVTYLYWGSDYQPITSAVYYWQLVKHDVADANPCRCFVDDSRLCSHLCQHATTNGWLDHYGNCSLTIPHTIKANSAR